MQSGKKNLDSRICSININECDCAEKTPIGCPHEAKIVATLSANLTKLKRSDILWITPYKAQLDHLTRNIKNDNVKIKTIDTVQGDEAENVIKSMGRHKGQGFINEQRMNVALSRAREWTFVVGHLNVIENCQAMTKVLQMIKSFNQNFQIS